MKNLNPIYLMEDWTSDRTTLSNKDRALVGSAIGGTLGAGISKVMLSNVKDIKEFVLSTENAEQCINGLLAYQDSNTPIALIAKKCIKYCKYSPGNYKQRCLKLLNNYYALGMTGGTLGGTVGGGSFGYLLSDLL